MKVALKYFLVVLVHYFVVDCEGNSQGCQCDSLIIKDKYGKVTGNCKSEYNGVPWCYLQKGGSGGCTDRQASKVLKGRLWSHEACVHGLGSRDEPQPQQGWVEPQPQQGWIEPQPQTQQGNGGCQCDSLTVTDRHGNIKGDCRSFYEGSPWCFLPENIFSSCSDARASKTVEGRQWSHEACGNPVGGLPQFEPLLDPVDSLSGPPIELYDPSGQVVVEIVDPRSGQSVQIDPPIELYDPSGQVVVEVVDPRSEEPSPLVDSTIELYDPSGQVVVEVVNVH